VCPSLAASEVHTAFEQKPDGQPGQRKQTHPHPPYESPVAFFAVLQTSAASRHSLTQYAVDTNGDWRQHEQNVSPPPCPCPFSTPRRGRIGQKTPCPVLLLRPGLAKKHVDCYLSYTSHPPLPIGPQSVLPGRSANATTPAATRRLLLGTRGTVLRCRLDRL